MGMCPWVAFLRWMERTGCNRIRATFQPTGATRMNAHIKSYLWFLGFMAVTKIVVAPVAKQLNIPVVSDIVG